jgi:hypothetical protein
MMPPQADPTASRHFAGQQVPFWQNTVQTSSAETEPAETDRRAPRFAKQAPVARRAGEINHALLVTARHFLNQPRRRSES